MTFIFTTEDAQPIANKLIKIYKNKKYKIEIERPLCEDDKYRATLIAKNRYESILIEVQSKLSYHSAIKDMANSIAKDRKNCELYIALDSNATIFANHLTDIKKDGIGLMILKEGDDIEILVKAKNFSLIVNPEPTLNFGKFTTEVNKSLKKFNEVNRKDGLRDLCEVFECSIEDLGTKLCRKGKFSSLIENGFIAKKLIEKIDILASNKVYSSSSAVIDDTLKTDLHAFRNARNLVDHKTKNKTEEVRRQTQYADKMMLGPRLIHELEKIRKKIK